MYVAISLPSPTNIEFRMSKGKYGVVYKTANGVDEALKILRNPMVAYSAPQLQDTEDDASDDYNTNTRKQIQKQLGRRHHNFPPLEAFTEEEGKLLTNKRYWSIDVPDEGNLWSREAWREWERVSDLDADVDEDVLFPGLIARCTDLRTGRRALEYFIVKIKESGKYIYNTFMAPGLDMTGNNLRDGEGDMYIVGKMHKFKTFADAIKFVETSIPQINKLLKPEVDSVIQTLGNDSVKYIDK